MTNELHKQIYNELNLRETNDLLEIWQTNNRAEWSDIAFEIIKQILTERGLKIPEQDAPVEYNEGVIEDNSFDFSEEELKIIDDENPPEFYDPFQVLKVSKWLEKIAIASIYIVLISGVLQFPRAQSLAQAYLQGIPSLHILVSIIAAVSTSLAVLIEIITTYFPLKALAQILRILMEMEFNSRKAK
ncbi:MAG: hypothetical protein WBW94_16800 [Anaerolineales bacterium]